MRSPNGRGSGSAIAITLLLALTMAPTAVAARQVSLASPPDTATEVDSGVLFAGGAGFANGSAKVAGSTGSEAGLAWTFMLAGQKNGWRTFSAELQVEPFDVPNTQRAEQFSSVNVIVSGYLGPLGLGLGYQRRSWGGEDVWVDSDGGVSIQITLAPKMIRRGGWAISPDLFMRFSSGDEIGTSSLGARVLVGRLAR